MRDFEVGGAHDEHGSPAHEHHVNARSQGAGDYKRNERTRLELEQEQLDGEDHPGNGSAERGRHSRGCAGCEQHLALSCRGMQHLPE